jgi:hypothetical protein
MPVEVPLARLVAGAERPPLPGRGLRGPPAPAGRERQNGRLASRWVVAAGAEVQVHLPTPSHPPRARSRSRAGLEGEQLGVARESWSRLYVAPGLCLAKGVLVDAEATQQPAERRARHVCRPLAYRPNLPLGSRRSE